ncbi:hypothetical protein PENCOP_c016G07734 [Penicillium coprophilum]|uniref:Xylanolytic transcriptional activator regulatory domain-containing protein n=1 Tax=Penicillium coprophilum TaxID=36646 RepID=A0A1V6U874_9EURO|nr:hypothetical protein PENCOP_c016G07734 [Penicillium coprophilum]
MLTGQLDRTPCLNSIAHYSNEADQLPAVPVLSIIDFTFHTGVNISDPSQLASTLWQKSLKFVSTIPGFRQLYWAPVKAASHDQEVIVLIQWKSGHGWKLFQSSLGFSMLLGYMQNISNRCIQLTLPENLFSFDSALEIVSFQFSDTLSTARVDQKSDFKSKWESTISLYPRNDTTEESELVHYCGEWLELDYASEDQFFLGLLFWKSSTGVFDQRRLREANFHNLGHHIADLVKDTTGVISACTNHLNKLSFESATPQELNALLTPIAVEFETNHPVFRTPVNPEYNVNELTFSENKDQLHLESMRQARERPPQRIAGGPAGGWYPMGTLSQHHLPPQRGYPTNPNMEWISFRAQLEDSRIARLFEDLRRKLWRMGDCPHLFWGKHQDDIGGSDRISLFMELDVPKGQDPETRVKFQQFIQEFSDECGHAQVKEYWRPTQLQSSPNIILETITHLPPRPIAEFLTNMFFKYVEINSFYMERKWIEEKMALCYNSTTTYTAIDFPWVCSVFVVLAIGTQVAHMEDKKPNSNLEATEELNLCSEDSVGLIFYHAACKLIPDVLLVASHESVQVFLLLATYALPVSTGGLAYTYYGLAMKMAIQNGMHRKYQGGNCDTRTIELRNRLFWTAYTVEKYISILHGRPMSIALSEINADMPRDCSSFESPRFSNLMAFHKLISYLGEVSETLAQFKKCPKRLLSDYLERLLQLRASIKQWWDSLPATGECRDLCSQGPNFRQNAHLRLCYLLIYVYMGRAFIFVDDRKEPGEAIIGADHDFGRASRLALVDDCVSSALDILNTLQSVSDHVGLCRASYNEFGACRAAILVILAESLNSGRTQRLQDGLHRGMGLIRQMVGGSSSKSEISYLESIEAAISQLLAAPEEDTAFQSQSDQVSISAYSKFKDWTQSLKKDKSASGNLDLSSFSPLAHLTPGTEPFAIQEMNDMTTLFDPDWSNGDFEFNTYNLSSLPK